MVLARPLMLFSRIMSPFITVLNNVANALLKLVGVNPAGGGHSSVHSADELRLLVMQARAQGTLNENDSMMLAGVFDFHEKKARDVMRPRTEVAAIPLDATEDEVWKVLRTERYSPPIYWLTVVLMSVVGTLITDNITDHFGIALAVSTGVFTVALLLVFAVWYYRERTLSIHHVDSVPRELFYWLAILTTFALGTAAGDWFAEALQMGYGNAALLFGGAIALVAVAHYIFKANAVLSFWIAYILTRPFGAALGDLLSQPHANGGMGLGTTGTSALFLATIVGLVGYLSITAQRHAAKDAQ